MQVMLAMQVFESNATYATFFHVYNLEIWKYSTWKIGNCETGFSSLTFPQLTSKIRLISFRCKYLTKSF